MKVKDLKNKLAELPDDADISFGGMTLHRLQWRGENLVDFEFNVVDKVLTDDLPPSTTELVRRTELGK
ncbi:MAG TPA: hypothetical protein PKM67_05225 [Kiritimatiellia bacterium]|nr:hypothetical protein [Kiritimatiellia bacterium]